MYYPMCDLMTSYILKLANLMVILPINSTHFLLVLHGMGRWFRDYGLGAPVEESLQVRPKT